MRKKLIAALAVQLAAVVFLLSFSGIMSALVDKYGKTLSVECLFDYNGYFTGNDGEEITDFYLSFYNYAVKLDDIARGGYSDCTGNINYVYLSVYNDEKYTSYSSENNDENVKADIWGTYAFKDKEIGEKVYQYGEKRLERAYDIFPRSFYKNNKITANIRVYRSRVKLLSITINGIDIEEYFSDPDNLNFK